MSRNLKSEFSCSSILVIRNQSVGNDMTRKTAGVEENGHRVVHIASTAAVKKHKKHTLIQKKVRGVRVNRGVQGV